MICDWNLPFSCLNSVMLKNDFWWGSNLRKEQLPSCSISSAWQRCKKIISLTVIDAATHQTGNNMYKALLIIPFSKESLRVLKANGLWQQKTVQRQSTVVYFGFKSLPNCQRTCYPKNIDRYIPIYLGICQNVKLMLKLKLKLILL